MHQRVQGGLETEQGKTDLVVGMSPMLEFDPTTKRLQRGEFSFQMADGTERPMRFEKLSETGFYLGAGFSSALERSRTVVTVSKMRRAFSSARSNENPCCSSAT